MDVASIGSLVGALGLGSVVGQYLASSTQRRTTRADVLSALSAVESARWVSSDERPSLVEVVRHFESAALVARMPRSIVEHYLVLAWAAYWMSSASWEENPDPEFGGGISGDVARVVDEAATDVARVAWSPWTARPRLSKRIADRESWIDRLIAKGRSTDTYSPYWANIANQLEDARRQKRR